MAEEDLGGMEDLAAESYSATDAVLAETELLLIKKTSTNMEIFRIHISDQVSFGKLIEATNESTQKNESIAAFKNRLTTLGEGVVKVAGKVAALAAKGII